MTRIALDEFQALLDAELPLVEIFGMKAESLGPGSCRMRMAYSPELIRPGGTIAGPALMALADACMYGVVLSQIGRVALAVTTNFNINFLRKPANTGILAVGSSIKLGKRLAVMEVSLFSEDDNELVAHATGTYSIPPNRA
ncbi:Phenylacetic acid degradation-related protein [Rhodospirillaceae bacterium LM-1]|nr:Phenylacetic acid degradation-related protein [Rhodospirillaceae bacterium LM-1]